MAWTKSFMFTPHPLFTRCPLWQNSQVWGSLRWPAWKASVVNTPMAPWQLRQFALAAMVRRGVFAGPVLVLPALLGRPTGSGPLMTFESLGAGTLTPPCPVPGVPAIRGMYG